MKESLKSEERFGTSVMNLGAPVHSLVEYHPQNLDSFRNEVARTVPSVMKLLLSLIFLVILSGMWVVFKRVGLNLEAFWQT